jgi:putative toxin-antitoxin system antitoxin component (TIGR02293 family)
MVQAHSAPAQPESVAPIKRHRKTSGASPAKGGSRSGSARRLIGIAFEANEGWSKARASQLFERVAATSPLPTGKLRAELIPDSSWKRAGKTLGPQASQTTARLGHILVVAESVWGNESDATEWLNSPHPELHGATPLSLLKTEAGGRAVEALLAALEFGFPV